MQSVNEAWWQRLVKRYAWPRQFWTWVASGSPPQQCLDEFVSSFYSAPPRVFKCDLRLGHPGEWHQQTIGGAPTKWRHSEEVHCAECERLRGELDTLRGAWNAHFKTCPAPIPNLPTPTLEQINAWMDAPSNTASPAAGDGQP